MKQCHYYVRNAPWRGAMDLVGVDDKASWSWQSPEWWIKCDGLNHIVEAAVTSTVYRSMWPNVGLAIWRGLRIEDE